MTKKKKAPEAFARFEELTKKLLRVPKAELDKKMRRYETNKQRRKKDS